MMNRESDMSEVIPQHVILETVHGCNARCTMCPVSSSSIRKKGIMPFEHFREIIDSFIPFQARIEMMDLFGMGEPLLDQGLIHKIRYAKDKGFRHLAIATNADLLTGELAVQLYEAGLDTIIFSIDGIRKETHEAIRRNTNFSRVMKNAQETITRRDNGGYVTRFVFRFIRQERNREEWEAFRTFWEARISKERGDKISGYDMRSWGGAIPVPGSSGNQAQLDALPCHHLFDHLIILWDGTVPLCCADMPEARYALGNIRDDHPIKIFNNSRIQRIRRIHNAGKRRSIKICAACSILESEKNREIE